MRKPLDINAMPKLSSIKLWLLSLFISVGLAVALVAVIEVLLMGKVTYHYLLTGLITSISVSAVVAAFGIINLRTRQEQLRSQAVLLKVAAGVSAPSGNDFFEQLVRNMIDALDAQAGFVVRLLSGDPLAARTIAGIVDGKVIENFDYFIEGTPCESLLKNNECVIPFALTEYSLSFSSLSNWVAEAFVGNRLVNSAGQTTGLLFVLYRKSLKQSNFIISNLKIFAVRAATEIEREDSNTRIHDQASLLDKIQDAIVVFGLDDRVIFWNKSAERFYGWTAEEVLGNSIAELVYDEHSHFREATCNVIELGEWNGEIIQTYKGGRRLIVESRWTLVKDNQGQPLSILTISTDITRRKTAENEIQHLAFYDPLTNLPNRQLLLDRLNKAMSSAARGEYSGALLFINLDNFKKLNDNHGHDLGDLLLKQVAQRLIKCVRGTDTVARFGGDEFIVMLTGLNTYLPEAATQLKNIGEKILAIFTQPFQLAEYVCHCTPSIGVTLFDEKEISLETILKRANLAMNHAKVSGKNTFYFFDPKMQAMVTAHSQLEESLRQGIEDEQFVLHYQPQVNSSRHITGVEVLLRWQHKERGLVSPLEFIPIAEETGLIVPLGYWVLKTACSQLVKWEKQPKTAHLTLAVNISMRQFRQPDFTDQILTVLDQTGANPEKLKLELTESLLIKDVEDTVAKMTALKAKGVGFSLDDFGTGYSSLAYLKKLPLDQLKIDQSFVRDVLTDTNDAAIARTIITLAHSLGLAVIAEGVETEDQRSFLASHGCNAYQGYLFSKPVPLEQLEELLVN